MRWIPVGAMLTGCWPGLDEGGCPIDGLSAIGDRCGKEGHQCYENSLCDPCTSDLSACEALTCIDGRWVELELPTVCTAEG